MKTKHQQPVKNSQIDGDVAIGRHVSMGGDATVQGKTLLKGDTIIEGWLIAPNVVSTYKGFFRSEKLLQNKYPVPNDGWWCFVGNTLYVVSGGEWKIATGNFVQDTIDGLDKRYLSKQNPDIAQGLITFKQGLQIGNYTEGINGFGGNIDEFANAELESLKLRRFLEVPEFRFNRISIQVGNKWNAPGGGIIEKCVPDLDLDGNILNTGTIYLHLEDGEVGTIEVDDICQGIFHDAKYANNNSIKNHDDSRGNFLFAGFYTSYFRITEIIEKRRNSQFRYALRGISENWSYSHHPQESMHFVGYGNFDTVHHPERQTSRYSTRTYERFLRHVNDWEIRAENIAAQFGDLSNLSVFGMNMEGYSAYLNNIYMSGVIEQLEQLPLRLDIDTEGDNTLAYGEHLHITCKVFRGWQDKTSEVIRWEINRDSGYAADDAAWALRPKVMNFDSTIDIYLDKDASIDDLGNCDVSCLFTIKAYLNGVENPVTKQLIV